MLTMSLIFFPLPKAEKRRIEWQVTETNTPFGSGATFSDQEWELREMYLGSFILPIPPLLTVQLVVNLPSFYSEDPAPHADYILTH